jgi:hypothetical protein
MLAFVLLELCVAAERALQLDLRHAQQPRRDALHGGQQDLGVPAPTSSRIALIQLLCKNTNHSHKPTSIRKQSIQIKGILVILPLF